MDQVDWKNAPEALMRKKEMRHKIEKRVKDMADKVTGYELLPIPSGPYTLRCVLAAKLLDKTRPHGLREGTVGRVESSPFELQRTGEWRIMLHYRGVHYCLPLESLQLTETNIPSPCIKEHEWK